MSSEVKTKIVALLALPALMLMSGCSEPISVEDKIADFKADPVPENCTWAGWSKSDDGSFFFPICVHSKKQVNAKNAFDTTHELTTFGQYGVLVNTGEAPSLHDSYGNSILSSAVNINADGAPTRKEWIDSMKGLD